VLAKVAQSVWEDDSTEFEIEPLLEALCFILVLEIDFPLEKKRTFFVEAVDERSRSYYLGLWAGTRGTAGLSVCEHEVKQHVV
jgi:hypothetical protein